jgi:hypothetical protein
MTRHGQQDRRGKAPALWPKEPHVVNTANCANDTGLLSSQGLGKDAWGRNARPAELSAGCHAARKPNKAQAEIVKSP